MAKKNAPKPKTPPKASAPAAKPAPRPAKGKPEKPAKADKTDKPARVDKVEKPARPIKPEKAPRIEKPAKPERAEKPAKPEKPPKQEKKPLSEVDRLKAELQAAVARLKQLDSERRQLSQTAVNTERALMEEAARRSNLERRLEVLGGPPAGELAALQAKVSELKLHLEAAQAERDALQTKLRAGDPEAAKKELDENRKRLEVSESKVRALSNERDGLKAQLKELESTSQAAADRAKVERLEEKCMDLERERDSFKERLTDLETQMSSAPSPEVVDRLKTSLADAERDRDRYRDKVRDLEAQIAAARGGLPVVHGASRVSVLELQSRLEESEREREKAERERDELEKRLHAVKTELYARRQTPEEGEKHFCPGCGTEMRSQVTSSVRMEVCPQCAGVYFGKGEIASIVAQERELVRDAAKGSFFGRIFGTSS